MLQTEEVIQEVLNEAGVLASKAALEQFDTDGSPIEIGGARWTSKGQEPKIYQTPYGEAVVARHVYQTSEGGATFCPLEREARIIITSTPRFAMQVSSKYADRAGGRPGTEFAGPGCAACLYRGCPGAEFEGPGCTACLYRGRPRAVARARLRTVRLSCEAADEGGAGQRRVRLLPVGQTADRHRSAGARAARPAGAS